MLSLLPLVFALMVTPAEGGAGILDTSPLCGANTTTTRYVTYVVRDGVLVLSESRETVTGSAITVVLDMHDQARRELTATTCNGALYLLGLLRPN